MPTLTWRFFILQANLKRPTLVGLLLLLKKEVIAPQLHNNVRLGCRTRESAVAHDINPIAQRLDQRSQLPGLEIFEAPPGVDVVELAVGAALRCDPVPTGGVEVDMPLVAGVAQWNLNRAHRRP